MVHLNSANTLDLSVAAFGRIVGAAKYESGVAIGPDPLVASQFGTPSHPVHRIVWGVRAAIGDFFRDPVGQDLKRDEITFQMMGENFFKEVQAELRDVVNEVTDPTRQRPDVVRAERIVRELQGMLSRSSLNTAEQEALTKYAKAVLNTEPRLTDSNAYRARIIGTLEVATDAQYEKIRDDGKFRWRGFFSNMVVSAVSKSASILISPLLSPIAGVFGVAAVETALQQYSKRRMEEKGLETKTNHLSKALNQEIDAFYSPGPNSLPHGLTNDPRAPLQRLKDATTALNPIDPALSEEDKAKVFNQASDAARFLLENARNLDELVRGDAKLSIVTAERYALLKQEIREQIDALKDAHVIIGVTATDYSDLLREAIGGLQEKYQNGPTIDTRTRTDVAGVDAVNYHSTYAFVDKIRDAERVKIERFTKNKLRGIRHEATSIDACVSKFAWNSVSSALAVLGAGMKAIADADTFAGPHMIGVNNKGMMQLEFYLRENAADAFGMATGLDKLGVTGRMISDSCGGMAHHFVKFYTEFVNGPLAWDETLKPTSAVRPIKDLLDEAYKHTYIPGELREIAKNGLHHACQINFDEKFGAVLSDALQFAGWWLRAGSWLGAAGAVAIAGQQRNSKDHRFLHTGGYATPAFATRPLPVP